MPHRSPFTTGTWEEHGAMKAGLDWASVAPHGVLASPFSSWASTPLPPGPQWVPSRTNRRSERSLDLRMDLGKGILRTNGEMGTLHPEPGQWGLSALFWVMAPGLFQFSKPRNYRGRLRDAAKAKLQEQTNDLGRGENRIKANEIFVTSKFFGQRGEKKFKFSLCLEDPKT